MHTRVSQKNQKSEFWNVPYPKYAYLAYLAIFGIFGRVFGRAKYGQVGCPWKNLAKCSSDTLVLGQQDPPVKSKSQISFLALSPQIKCKTSDRWQCIIYGSINLKKKITKPSFAQPKAHVKDWGRNHKFYFVQQPNMQSKPISVRVV